MPTLPPPSASNAVLVVAHVLHPVDGLAIELLCNGNVRHTRRCRRTMPMFLTRREPHHISRSNLFHRPSLSLRPATPSRHNQSLPQWMRVPGSPSPRLEGDNRPSGTSRLRALERLIDPYRTREPVCGSLIRWLRTDALDFHIVSPS